MRVLADTNLFVKFCQTLPLPRKVEEVLDAPDTVRCLSAISIAEIYRLWQVGKLKDNPDEWIFRALTAWKVLDINTAIARQAVLWPWQEHRDPADRIIAATAQVENVELWHTDTELEKFPNFPQRYFKNVA